MYAYKIADSRGNVREGKIDASSRDEVAEHIGEKPWFIVFIREDTGRLGQLSNVWTHDDFSGLERIVFTDHLAAMIASGTPIVEAVRTYGEEDGKKPIRIVDEIIKSVREGRTLSQALGKFPKTFPSFYLSLVSAGELTGRLDETLQYLASELRREFEFKERIKSALIYPIFVLAVAFLVIILLVFLVIPKITELTKSLGGDLPLSTRIVASGATYIQLFGPFMLILPFILIVAGVVLFKNPKTKTKLEPYLLRLPLVGGILRKYIIARFLRIVGSCLKYGIHLTTAFDTASKVTGNIVYQKACDRMRSKVTRGVSLSEALHAEGTFLFPNIIVRTARGAEKTGSVDQAMLRMSGFYESDIDRQLKRVTDLIEPVLVVVLGLIVGSIAISVIAPIYQITSKIK